jgi:hypothetical protein
MGRSIRFCLMAGRSADAAEARSSLQMWSRNASICLRRLERIDATTRSYRLAWHL